MALDADSNADEAEQQYQGCNAWQRAVRIHTARHLMKNTLQVN
jgi:hypothetical protein